MYGLRLDVTRYRKIGPGVVYPSGLYWVSQIFYR